MFSGNSDSIVFKDAGVIPLETYVSVEFVRPNVQSWDWRLKSSKTVCGENSKLSSL